MPYQDTALTTELQDNSLFLIQRQDSSGWQVLETRIMVTRVGVEPTITEI